MSKAHRPATGKTAEGKTTVPDERTRKIRDLNDRFRQTLRGGQVVATSGVHALGLDRMRVLLIKVQRFATFTQANDPYGEHDFGTFDDGRERFFWKIDYYDPTLTFGSADPSDPKKTQRVLTIMLASEY